ncbi:MAG TPA: tetratricopeptide repeat protein [Planctomycetaceae bacterium]|nr:tetratricopeptide repeat protein [Planctomycetaceae bacterium]
MRHRARASLASRDPQSAIDWLDFGWRFQAPGAEEEFLRARAYRKQGRWDLVHRHLELALRQGIDRSRIEREQWLASAQSGDLRDSLSHLPLLLERPEGDGPEICEAYVNGFFLNNRLDEALQLIAAWLADYPADPLPYRIRGKIRVNSGELKQAAEDFRQVLKLLPRDSSVALELGQCLASQRDYEGAVGPLEQAARDPKTATAAKIELARCFRLQGKLDEARAHLAPLLEKSPDDPEILAESGQIELQAGQFSQAIPDLERSLRAYPRSVALHQALGRALLGAGRDAESREHFVYVERVQLQLARVDKLIDYAGKHPRDAQCRYEIGKIYLDDGVPERGVKWLQSALNCDPEHRASHAALAEYYGERKGVNPAFAAAAERHRAAAARFGASP